MSSPSSPAARPLGAAAAVLALAALAACGRFTVTQVLAERTCAPGSGCACQHSRECPAPLGCVDGVCDVTPDPGTVTPKKLPGEACAAPAECLSNVCLATASGSVCCAPRPEQCNGVDDDCDGVADDGFMDAQGRYVADTDCGSCGHDCTVLWNPALHHGAVGRCDVSSGTPTCTIDPCPQFVDSVSGVRYETVNIPGDPRGTCACVRVLGNAVDEPDEVFPGPGGAPAYPAADAAYADADCDGVDGVEAAALFVSAAAAPGGAGTRLAPFATVGAALAALPASGRSYVLVAGGDYAEAIVLSAGVRLHGGYSLDFRRRNVATLPTRLLGVPASGASAPTVQAIGIRRDTSAGLRTVLSGFVVTGPDVAAASAPGAHGAASEAIVLLDCDDAVAVSDNVVIGGRGGDGADGAIGSDGFGSASPGGSVLAGGAGTSPAACTTGACAGLSIAGGAGGVNPACPAANGLAGGDVACPVYGVDACTRPDPAKDGLPGRSWTLDLQSNPGCSTHVTEAGYPSQIRPMSGGDGRPGASGGLGTQGFGCVLPQGGAESGVWTPMPALRGDRGSDGERGGRGASSGGLAMAGAAELPAGVSPYGGAAAYKPGASGGGAGAGGCGGAGGEPGGAGGASIAIRVGFTGGVTVATPPSVGANVVERGQGGVGGNGGFGGRGGRGGAGGAGGTEAAFWIAYRAGSGAGGGDGGVGGGGGGGCGGPSLGVVVAGGQIGWMAAYGAANDLSRTSGVQAGGAGGKAGPSGAIHPMSAGMLGESRDVIEFPP
jgi:hypothetical protein